MRNCECCNRLIRNGIRLFYFSEKSHFSTKVDKKQERKRYGSKKI